MERCRSGCGLLTHGQMFCTKCGSPNFDDAIVCKKCASPFAAKFTRPNRTVASQASGIKRLTIQLLGWGLIGATLIMGLVLVADFERRSKHAFVVGPIGLCRARY